MPAADELTQFHDAIKATLTASGVLGRVRAELKFAALEAVNRANGAQPNEVAGPAMRAHHMAMDDDAAVIAHALVLDFLASQPTLHRSASVFASEADVERVPERLRDHGALRAAAGGGDADAVPGAPNEPVLVSLLRRPGGLAAAMAAPAPRAASPSHSPSRQDASLPGEENSAPSRRPVMHADPLAAAAEAAPVSSAETSPIKAAFVTGPSDSPAAKPRDLSSLPLSLDDAAGWAPIGTAAGGTRAALKLDASLEVSDMSADDRADAAIAEGVEWEHVEQLDGDDTGSAPAPAPVPAPAPHAAVPAPSAAPAAPLSSMQPPEDTPTPSDRSEAGAAQGVPGADTLRRDSDTSSDEDDYGDDDYDDDEF